MKKPVEYLYIVCDYDDDNRAYETCANKRDASRALKGLIAVFPRKALYIRREKKVSA